MYAVVIASLKTRGAFIRLQLATPKPLGFSGHSPSRAARRTPTLRHLKLEGGKSWTKPKWKMGRFMKVLYHIWLFVAHALDKSITKIETAILNALEMTPPELSADIL